LEKEVQLAPDEDAAATAIDDTLLMQLGAEKKNSESKEILCYNHGGKIDERINRDDGFECSKCVEEENYPMLCIQHGGSVACEEINKKYGHKCPKCELENLNENG
jgi:hypothetical protein